MKVHVDCQLGQFVCVLYRYSRAVHLCFSNNHVDMSVVLGQGSEHGAVCLFLEGILDFI